jgi:cytochrome c-type biogenesis protein CcmH/NrfG
MTKLHLPTLPKFLNRTVLLVSLTVVALLAITAYGAVRSVQQSTVEAQAQAAAKAKAESDAKDLVILKDQNKHLENELSFQTAKANQTCDWIRSQQAKYRYTVPPLCKL